ncbi:hypothetical protein M9979_04255 [Sphingomonas sp. RP10(2022)]|uniref:Uncharacterized protein n=1 Tax=Sphingomonas liriopis TaxID=2949094 RepID=A0A9X2HV30_9SPHN|nr:hypothetical protein [Sphingomonas liriopis]MCP3734088.1 hypothetical protein [Sphingomonas liriopis]
MNMLPKPIGKRAVYIPGSLSEIYDMLGSMILGAPTFVDKTGYFPEHDIDYCFQQLTEGFAVVRSKLGEERYATLIGLAARAKALFAADPNGENGKTDEGYPVLFEMEEIIKDASRRRFAAKVRDDEGEVTGD